MKQDQSLLETIHAPPDLQSLTLAQLQTLASEIRDELLSVVSANGGHLASNLGAVELTIALLRVFGGPADSIVWDTGHQTYPYKLLTGRRELFKNLRQYQGCCGFLSRDESKFDIFGAGHAGTAISAATGLAVARERQNREGRVVAVVGDGALGCGVSLEGLNSVIEATNRLIVVLNDNKMSISPNVGALSHYLNRIISDHRYNRMKGVVSRTIGRIPMVGGWLHRLIHRFQEGAKGILLDGVFFEELGFRYIGPLNGHSIEELIGTFERLKPLDSQPLLIHVLTEKGHGYKPAENDPASYHGLGRFDPETGRPVKGATADRKAAPVSFGESLGQNLCRMLEQDPRLVAITAGMCDGTGLGVVRKKYPQRFFDVGIAEEHAVVFAAGMATQGVVPIVAIYASFMQRALDYAFHDVALQKLPVIFCLDRAGVVPDGPTHHGIHDLGFWRAVPGIAVVQPANGSELREMLQWAVAAAKPCVIRYPKCDDCDGQPAQPLSAPLRPGKAETVRTGENLAIWCLGRETVTGLETAAILADNGIQATVVNTRFIQPFDSALLIEQAQTMPIVTIEDHSLGGGLGDLANGELANLPEARTRNFGWPRHQFVPWGDVSDLRRQFGLNPEHIAQEIMTLLQG